MTLIVGSGSTITLNQSTLQLLPFVLSEIPTFPDFGVETAMFIISSYVISEIGSTFLVFY